MFYDANLRGDSLGPPPRTRQLRPRGFVSFPAFDLWVCRLPIRPSSPFGRSLCIAASSFQITGASLMGSLILQHVVGIHRTAGADREALAVGIRC